MNKISKIFSYLQIKIKNFLLWLDWLFGLSWILSSSQYQVFNLIMLFFRLFLMCYSNYIVYTMLKQIAICIIILNLFYYILKFWIESDLYINTFLLEAYFKRYKVTLHRQKILRLGITALIPYLERRRFVVMFYYSIFTFIVTLSFNSWLVYKMFYP
jgi:hypothetical protein